MYLVLEWEYNVGIYLIIYLINIGGLEYGEMLMLWFKNLIIEVEILR